MWCEICGYQKHEGCCEECIGHTTDGGQCVTVELLDVPVPAIDRNEIGAS